MCDYKVAYGEMFQDYIKEYDFWGHCDMDMIFGEENFINEIIWNYKSGGTCDRRFARKHDTLLFYGKSDK